MTIKLTQSVHDVPRWIAKSKRTGKHCRGLPYGAMESVECLGRRWRADRRT